jgi:hypothetical protein
MVRVGIVCVFVALAGAARADEKPTIGDVKKAWTARHEAAKSFRAEWVETVVDKAGSFGSFDPKDPGPHPPKDTELKVTRSFAADGEKAAFVGDSWAYWQQKKEFTPYKETIRFDGVAAQFFEPDPKTGWQRVSIETDKERAAGWLRYVPHEPLLLVYRPLGEHVLTGGLENYQLSGRTEQIRGATCVELVRKDAAKYGSVDSLWCDPDREFLPIRHTERVGNAGEDTEWEYRKNDKGQWVPTGWQYTRFSGKRGKDYVVTSTTKATMKKLELGVTFPADAFSTQPPLRSHVFVSKAGKRQEAYLIRPDGSKRPLSEAEELWNPDNLAKTNADGTPYVAPKK